MKKIFKLTLFKKIFFIIFVGMLNVESFHLYLDFRATIDNELLMFLKMVESTQLEIVNTYENTYHSQLSSKFIEYYNQYLEDTGGYFAIVDDKKLLKEVNQIRNQSKIPSMEVYGNGSRGISIKLDDVDEEILTQLDQYIYNSYYEDEPQNIRIEMTLKEFKLDDENITRTSPIYLKFGDIEYPKQNSYKTEEYRVEYYNSNNFNYGHIPTVQGGKGIFDYNKIEKRLREIVTNKEKSYEVQTLEGNTKVKYFFIDDALWIYDCIMAEDMTEFIHIYPLYTPKEQIINRTIVSKIFVYPLALLLTFVMSIIISYMLTRRIKKIDKTTQSIADGNFDLLLSEKSKDEIGGLSRSINTMSQQLKHTIEQLNDEIEHVKELESLRKDFINQFTHEMKTPLGIINGYSELLDEAQSEEEKEKYLQIINRETNHINKLIESMLNLSRLEAGKVELHLEKIDLEDMMTEIIDEYEVLLMKKEVKVDIKSINPHIQGDKELIKTVIHNFLSNAIKHVNQKGCINIELDNGCSVYNEGDMIEEKNLKSIWHTFVTHDQQGSGLGLAICSSILELHGFDYGVDNINNGVCFYFKGKEVESYD